MVAAGRLIHKENAGNRFGIDNVVPAPAAGIVLDYAVGKTAESTLPGDTEPGTEIYQEIGASPMWPPE